MNKTIVLTSNGMESVDVRKEIIKLLPKPSRQIELAHIITASNVEKSTDYVKRDKRQMLKLGLQVEDIDLKGKTEKVLKSLLEGKDVIYVQGGNAFYLLKYVRESGFHKVVKELIQKGVVYIGASAGSYIACPTIEMATWKHQDKNRVGLKDLKALNLAPFLITVHYESKYKAILKKEIPKAKFPVRILRDNQALLISNGKVKFVGKGEEVKSSDL
ncbi:hypothetical protein A2714_04075 [Candidatus Woesebacteria bacterium RIFCSPHIGHO2_01_FULL_38_9]|uniref:Uncharacterized protein n=2 Tax=Candidatus Woeseibacteriota TaxID=1752722 RepID=A0A1F7XZP9_9BACT|nr:MAG: hypothetical protein A2714_04075 [Candidatus Woesebacteria bacterium RIFCSPHIGHO2_01_FULL_38_9]OGM60087.1 MAG: hypothetical protein A3A75_01640 [Candidatus Woesebacteria bacterium RIFCSPLOWO2_01_FULL_39_10]